MTYAYISSHESARRVCFSLSLSLSLSLCVCVCVCVCISIFRSSLYDLTTEGNVLSSLLTMENFLSPATFISHVGGRPRGLLRMHSNRA